MGNKTHEVISTMNNTTRQNMAAHGTFIYNHYHRIYDELTTDHLSMWLGSSLDRALHRYRKVMGSSPVRAWIFFSLLFQLLKLKAHCEDHNFTRIYVDCKTVVHFALAIRMRKIACEIQNNAWGWKAILPSSAFMALLNFFYGKRATKVV